MSPPSGGMAAGTRGAAVAGHPLAAYAGLKALEKGGTAVDACLAMAATAWVVMPDMGGPGGDLFALWRDPDGTVRAANGAGPAPSLGFPGPNAENRAALALVPGAPAAIAALRPFCRLDLAVLFETAIGAAEKGFVVTARLDKQLQALPEGSFRDALFAAWGGAPRVGGTVRAPALAASLAAWARSGDGTAPLAGSQPGWAAGGSLLQPSDLAGFAITVEKPLALRLGAWTIHGQPPMSQAVASLAAMGIAGMDALTHADHPWREHFLIEAYKRAFAGLADLGDDGRQGEVAAALIGAGAMRERREGIGPGAVPGPAMSRNYGETTQCAAADAEGRVATVIHSLYRPFGSRVISVDTGWIANDRGASFSEGANRALPGRRPRHTLVNLIASHADGDAFALGTPGAQAQTQTTLQVLSRLMRDRGDLYGAVAAPRWSFIGSDRVAVEAAMAGPILDGLAQRGHALAVRPPADWLMGSVGLAAYRSGAPASVADHRREALALAL